MRVWFAIVAAAASLASLSRPALCQTEIAGAGVLPCSLVYAKAESAVVAFTWAQGFLSGMNSLAATTRTQQLRLSDPAFIGSQREFLKAYCDQNPGHQFTLAVQQLWMNMARLQGATK